MVLCTLYTVLGYSQNFPVQVIPQAIPPAPIHFSDYADASTVSSPLRVQIILNDLEIANREVRLKAHFQGNGITFQSNDIVVGADPLFLEGGVPLILTNVELAPYFQFQNITGISPNVYGQAIPEGAYQFCFEVYDVLSGNRLSNKSCATTVVFQNEPPFLVMPRDKTNIEEINPQSIVFQWTPRSINVTNVEYELSLVEIWDTQIDPQAAFLSSPPVFQTTTTATTYVYGPVDPLLLSGKNYAWRVQARAKQGIEEIGLFKNEGYSEIFSFSYAGSCDLPLSLNHEVKGSTNANIFWDDFTTDIPEYTVRYRKKGNDNEWFLSKTTTNQLTLWDLKAGTTYEYQIQKKCTVTGSDWSLAKEFTTSLEFEEESVIDCGISPDINLTNTDPLASISTGTSFKAGDFPVKITEVSGSNGRFTGKGFVSLPYLKNIKVAVEFTNILINTDQEMAEGTVNTVYDPTWKNMLSVDETIETVDNAVDAITDLANSIGEALNLDISKDTKEKVNQIVDAMVANMNNEDLPEELLNKIETAAAQMKEAKEQYDNAIANGDTTAAETAQNNFNTAQGNLKEAQKEVEKYKDEVADLLKEAILDLYREGRDIKDVIVSEYNALLFDSTQNNEDSIIEFGFSVIDQGIVEKEKLDSQTVEAFDIEKTYAVYLFSKVLSEEVESDLFSAFLENARETGSDFSNIISENQDTPKEQVIELLKEELRIVFIKILLK
ncbi:fibronectin type III domain-containing protein [Maribacter polysiphoniae]|uniref:Fibronectin type III domain protein n=1 Tax=Maribacter polysiphoniae TaxID=429344 RepID=A0A316E5W3_9FLAO|nr:fibronectin type III domain-containing protein [Maribacter polysiphoniae]MBD1260319.1 fibronectin type III domain-containing protein [Maribacter polysiphoniae]PWK25781.1 fibronectin type III domain protein [Maribacter polysiphoniae]